jgi:beta-apo-4'-carotenal oxygenase
LIGAIAAGNTAVVKPSEVAPNVAAIVQHIIETSLDPTCYSVVQGGIPETTKLLEQKWDKIFYTGNAAVGTIIAKKAAETLTPVTLELGGRNPAIVTKNADVRLAARRLLWAKTVNAGQVCISQNYTMVDREVLPGFIEELKSALKEFFPNGVKSSEDFGRIVSGRQWARLKKMVDETKGRILIGGEMDESERYIAPTVIQVDSPSDSLLIDESFGPLMPILPVNNLDEAIKIANEVHSTPLGLYPFGTKKETDRALREIRSGGASVNDGFYHGSIPTLAFGGVGDSGQGAYRGKASFDCFTHRRSVTTTPGWMEGLLNVRYPPFKGKVEKFRKMTLQKPNFDREGKVNFSLVTYILTLGAESKTSGLIRYALVLLSK